MERGLVADVARVYELWDEYGAALTAGDLDRWMEVWTPAGIQFAPGAPPNVGKEAIALAMKPGFDAFAFSDVVMADVEVRVLGDVAYSHGTYTYEMTPKAGGDAIPISGKFLDVVERQVDGSWKIVIDCHNYNAPMG